MNDEIKQAADEFATHKKDCTCKGKHYNEDKAKGFIAGANYANEKCQEEIKRLKEQNKIMKEALENIASSRYEANPWTVVETKESRMARQALEKIKEI